VLVDLGDAKKIGLMKSQITLSSSGTMHHQPSQTLLQVDATGSGRTEATPRCNWETT
jgi:hypothetical protein